MNRFSSGAEQKQKKKTWPGGAWRLFWCHPSMTPDSGVMIWLVRSLTVDKWAMNISLYYINTNEILGELSHENLIFSHVKITCYLHMWKNHLCYGYITYRTFHTKKLLKWNGLVFYWCLYNKQKITWPLGDKKFLFLCWKNISRVSAANKWNIFQHSKKNFVSLHSHPTSWSNIETKQL